MKFCTQCGAQLHDDDTFCTQCGHKVSQSQNEIHNNKNQPSSSKKSKFNKLLDVFNFENIGRKYRTIAKVISVIYILFFLIGVAFGILVLVISIANGFFLQTLLLDIILIPLCYFLLILVHISLWKLHAFADIYDSLCNDKTHTEKDDSSK